LTAKVTIAHQGRNSNSIIDTAYSLNTNNADTSTNSSSSYSKRPDTFDSGSTNSDAPVSVSIAARNNERERAHTPPFDASPQVHPTAAPQLDKPEKPPPTLRADTTHFAPNSQFVQGHTGHAIANLTRADTMDAAYART
jgi:hypothetical protein